ncbi:MAG: M28 family peptidase, partial [bacterium]
MRQLAIAFAFFLIFTAGVDSADLYRVWVNSPYDAAQLQSAQAEPLVRLNDGYLVLLDPGEIDALQSLEIRCEVIATGVAKGALALDTRLDQANVGKYPLVFESGRLRLYQADFESLTSLGHQPELMPIRNDNMKIEFQAPAAVQPVTGSRTLGDLDSLIALVGQSSLYSFDSTLQAFPGRVQGTAGNFAARDWIHDKFVEFGYDSVYLDPFSGSYNNVVATKLGTRFPDHQIVVGAHFDAVSGSPGADDNGSGTSGVLEVARILADIETDMTFVFIAFDAEESGLNGSYHYADAAYAAGDNIVYMYNMDMIGAINNANDVTVYHGAELGYSNIYNWLADSLVGVTGHLSGNIAQSDHWPFTQLGYTATFIIEYNFSPVYHTYQDSTTWMDFGYMTKLVRSALATCYYVSQTEGPLPSLEFTYPNGLPEILTPGQATTFAVEVGSLYSGVPVAASGTIHYNVDDHGWMQTAMVESSPGIYEATLPAFPDCYSRVEFYVSVEEATEGEINDPDPADPALAIVATEVIIPFADDFETNQGWTVSGDAADGQWNRGIPVGGGLRGDPPTDFDGSGQCYLTDNVPDNSDVDGGTTILTSPAIDLSAVDDALIHYARWYHNSFGAEPFVDVMHIYLSDDGGFGWVLVDSAGPTDDASGGWKEHSFWVSEYYTPTANMKLRFDASDLGGGSVVEAGVDAFYIKTYLCEDAWLCADINGNGVGPDIEDLVYLVSYMFQGGPEPPVMAATDV